MNNLNKYFTLNFKDKLCLIEAMLTLVYAKIIIVLVPLRKAASSFGIQNGTARIDLNQEEIAQAKRVRLFLQRLDGNLPWRSVCIDQAFACVIMLNRRKIPNKLCLGVLIDKTDQNLKAHAWVLCANQIVIGGVESENYTAVTTFANNFK